MNLTKTFSQCLRLAVRPSSNFWVEFSLIVAINFIWFAFLLNHNVRSSCSCFIPSGTESTDGLACDALGCCYVNGAATSQGLGLKSKISGTPGGVAAIGLPSDIPLTRIFSGSDSKEAATEAQTALVQQYAPAGRCSWKITQFRSCAQEQADLTLCEGFNESLRH
ncbi:coiled-coil-helix-coiled-coil-helix domain-containing protein 2-like [Topomyia yanbarensis]|uniref:coiled-coil-helix-coiled-coil-helix domain-containing protein 2-like n=1 Tax=Topomyia yanbarensis TaxID=2498891 RepID=UPI00273CC1BF|nr:coiled-coil-helix-coiled-coil-helix domain-containing protein 2-like [Topomyia yanbarensis]XP_058824330.1 coiled-coil-helix-coiled-coil-helix domain-containing protein 2-like [Topomyia yanbarensis]XP_058825225.1 coiled-coil-helix-coiled-coil-helix domain-containing protein 2-like [Topomyia yanbarensis]XP_058830952.1 coiled-coil-helix-coiled-coil-helix domain-containing protein 2-like [Topomyia yanbarensis]